MSSTGVRRLLWPLVVFGLVICVRFEAYVWKETMSAQQQACVDTPTSSNQNNNHNHMNKADWSLPVIASNNNNNNNNNNNTRTTTIKPLAPALRFFHDLFLGGAEESETTHTIPYPTFLDALDVGGHAGYIADPLALKRGVKAFLAAEAGLLRQRPSPPDQPGASSSLYFHVLQHYPRQHHHHLFTNGSTTTTLSQDLAAAKTLLAMDRICSVPGGQGEWEGPNGFRLLHQKIQLAPKPQPPNQQNNPRILCLMYTHSGKRDLARASALSWGVHCDGFLALSTETIPNLGMVHLVHPGKEEYLNMWQKIRSIWAYAGRHYLYDYDYFHIVGDDVFLMVDNLQHFLRTRFEHNNNNNKPILTGAHAVIWPDIDNIDYLIGGPGYTMNRAALKLFLTKGLDACQPNDRKSEEDQIISKCFQKILGVPITDSRDPITGEQLYHHQAADRVYNDTAKDNDSQVYMFRAKRYWSQQKHPQKQQQDGAIGHLDGLDAAHRHSIAFHFLRDPAALVRYTAIVHRLCPPETPLAKSLLT